MKFRLVMVTCSLSFLMAGSVALGLSRAPVLLNAQGNDAKQMIGVLERSGVQEQSSIESTFLQADEAFCVSGAQAKICQFSVGGGLFVRANAKDTDTFIKLIRKNGAESYAVANGRRWDLRNLECSTRFDAVKRKLVSHCSFEQ
jgi:hypothetical protein